MLDDLIDRYGDPPPSVSDLVNVSLVRVQASTVGVTEVTQKKKDTLTLQLESLELPMIRGLLGGLQWPRHRRCRQPALSLGHASARRKAAGAAAKAFSRRWQRSLPPPSKNKHHRSITMKKKLLALICALALVFSLVGCTISAPDTVGSIGDFEITSGMYLLAQYGAYQQAAQLAGTDQDTTDVKAFLKETITTDSDSGETAVVSDYVAQKTQETLETLAAVDARFKALGGELTDEQIATADRYAQQMMDQYGDTYTANGIGLETVKAYERLQVEHTALLDMVYGPDGETQWRTTS